LGEKTVGTKQAIFKLWRLSNIPY